MKKLFLLMSLLISISAVNAQNMKIVYQERLKTPGNVKELSDPAIAAAVAAQLNRMNKTMVLYYEKGESFFGQLPSDNKEQSDFQNNVQLIQANGSYYKSHKKNESVSQEYIMDKTFLITESLNSEWKLLSEEKKIGNYSCKKAVNDKNITAWYCPDIPVNDGPYLYQGLPGLILEIEMPTKIITMHSIDFNTDIKDKIKIPASGKKISREEFNKLLAKKKEELGVNGKNPVTVIKM
ncbi:MAG: GLPGLI family protein [Candidatus Symbiothrix sp.]|nr:GLPGLI family protein [Candidatus Symbiothrix sp.]